MKLTDRFYIHPTVPILLALSIIFDFFSSLAIIYMIVLIHEGAHLFSALLLNVKLKRVEIMPFGVTLLIDAHYIKDPAKEIIVASAGPAANIVLCGIVFILMSKGILNQEQGWFIFSSSGMLALVNIMPAMPLDGGRALKAALTLKWGFIKAFNFTMLITRFVAALMIIAGAALIYFTQINFSLFLISAFLLVNIISERRVGSMMIMRDILYSKNKLEKGVARGATIAAMYNKPACKLLRSFGYNNYYFVNVIDENMRYMATITETQIIDGLLIKGTRAKLYELLQ